MRLVWEPGAHDEDDRFVDERRFTDYDLLALRNFNIGVDARGRSGNTEAESQIRDLQQGSLSVIFDAQPSRQIVGSARCAGSQRPYCAPKTKIPPVTAAGKKRIDELKTLVRQYLPQLTHNWLKAGRESAAVRLIGCDIAAFVANA